MKLLRTQKSKTHNVEKFTFQFSDKAQGQASWISKGDDKEIICLPVEASCNLGCAFCQQTTENNGRKHVFTLDETLRMVDVVLEKHPRTPGKDLLISFMGSGEPLTYIGHVLRAQQKLAEKHQNIRFALATMMPRGTTVGFIEYLQSLKTYGGLPTKIHLSLHFTTDEVRQKYMPMAERIDFSLAMLRHYRAVTKYPIEIHYTLIKGVNDSPEDAQRLTHLCTQNDEIIPIKLLQYTQQKYVDFERSPSEHDFMRYLKRNFGNRVEFYTPPGLDIGAGCGQFFTDEDTERNAE